MMESKVECIGDLLNSCFLPDLNRDLDSGPLKSEDFDEYRKVLAIQLPVLYDELQLCLDWSFCKDEEKENELKTSLITLLAEVSARNALYAIHDEPLVKYAEELLQKCIESNSNQLQRIFIYYQKRLHKESWKKHLGTVYGFVKFIQVSFLPYSERRMPMEWLLFSLAVGLNVRDVHDAVFKDLGIKIFLVILDAGSTDDIANSNVHCVIYENAFKDVYLMNLTSSTLDVWNCLIKCLDYHHNINSLTWCQVDDMIEVLLRNISLSSDSLISVHLLSILTKLCVYFSINKEELESICDQELFEAKSLQEWCEICQRNNSYTPYRWAKNILNLFNIESYKLMQSTEICEALLKEMHHCYLVCIYPIPVKVLEPHLCPFLEKFTATLLEVIVVQNRKPYIIKLIKGILDTFFIQMHKSNDSGVNNKLQNCQNAFKILLTDNTFQ